MTYQEILDERVHEAIHERMDISSSMNSFKNSYAEYLKENFNGQIAEIQESIEKEQKKTKFRRFLDKLIKVL